MFKFSLLALYILRSSFIPYQVPSGNNALNFYSDENKDSVYYNKPLSISYKIPTTWKILSEKRLNLFSHFSINPKYLFGIEKRKSLLLLEDYDLKSAGLNNQQLVNKLRDTLVYQYSYTKKNIGFVGTLKPTKNVKLGLYDFTIIEYDIYITNLGMMIRSVFYVRSTIQNHVLVGFSATEDSVSFKEAEDGFSLKK